MEDKRETREKKRLIIGVSGASGAILAIRLLMEMKALDQWESHLILSDGAKSTIPLETSYSIQEVEGLADVVHDIHHIGSSIASGSFKTQGMVILPCSMKTVAGIATGYSDNLLLRAADVTIKERRPFILVPRESPFSTIHLRNLLTVAQAGAYIMPPVPPYYSNIQTLEEMNHQIIAKVLERFGIEIAGYKRWS